MSTRYSPREWVETQSRWECGFQHQFFKCISILVSGETTPAVDFTSPSTQVEDILPINHEDVNCCGHIVAYYKNPLFSWCSTFAILKFLVKNLINQHSFLCNWNFARLESISQSIYWGKLERADLEFILLSTVVCPCCQQLEAAGSL